MLIAATIAIALLLVLLTRSSLLYISTIRLQYKIDSLTRTRLQADMIREAWVELANQGATLKERLTQSAGSLDELKRHIRAAAKSAGVSVTIQELEPKDQPGAVKRALKAAAQLVTGGSEKIKGQSGTLLNITGTAAEGRILKLLVALDSLPAVIETDDLQLTGTGRGWASMKLSLHYYELKPKVAAKLKDFVEQLPAVPRSNGAVAGPERTVFLPHVVSKEKALRGWPKILLSGFTGDLALFFVGGKDYSLTPGSVVTQDIVYSYKLAVNQAMLRRKRDGSEVILTVGSPEFELPHHKVRDMSEFILTLQKRTPNDLFTPDVQP